MQAKYTRLFAGEGGDSFLEDTTAELQPTFTLPGVPAAIFSAPFSASEGCFWLGVPKTGMEDTLHTAPRRMVFVTTQGEYQVTTSGGVTRKFPVGSVLVVEDVSSAGHSTKITGTEDLIIFAANLPAA
jgi:hypothetical protein